MCGEKPLRVCSLTPVPVRVRGQGSGGGKAGLEGGLVGGGERRCNKGRRVGQAWGGWRAEESSVGPVGKAGGGTAVAL